jgi:hypothetical protein
MEKRWSLQFENETAKIELLGLEFLTEDEPKSKNDK